MFSRNRRVPGFPRAGGSGATGAASASGSHPRIRGDGRAIAKFTIASPTGPCRTRRGRCCRSVPGGGTCVGGEDCCGTRIGTGSNEPQVTKPRERSAPVGLSVLAGGCGEAGKWSPSNRRGSRGSYRRLATHSNRRRMLVMSRRPSRLRPRASTHPRATLPERQGGRVSRRRISRFRLGRGAEVSPIRNLQCGTSRRHVHLLPAGSSRTTFPAR